MLAISHFLSSVEQQFRTVSRGCELFYFIIFFNVPLFALRAEAFGTKEREIFKKRKIKIKVLFSQALSNFLCICQKIGTEDFRQFSKPANFRYNSKIKMFIFLSY